MIQKFKVTFPFVPDMGTISPIVVRNYPMETKEENALWAFNKMREHDCLIPRKKLPIGTKFTEIFD